MDGPVLVGTDGSPTAGVAVDEAIRLALALGFDLHIVSAYKPVAVSATGLPAEFQGTVSSTSKVDAILDDAASRGRRAGVQVRCHLEKGDPAEVILDVAESIGAGVIVVGNKGIGSAKRFILGNVPSKVVHHAPCSTFVVHTT